MRQAHEELAIEIDGKPLFAVGSLRIGAIGSQANVQQPMRFVVQVLHFDQFSQNGRIALPAIRDVDGCRKILGLQFKSGFPAAGRLA